MRKMQQWVLVGLVVVLLTLAFASSVYAGPPSPGSCPPGFEPEELTTPLPRLDRNGDLLVCTRQIGSEKYLMIDNNVGGPP
jgi:hypothetical protein